MADTNLGLRDDCWNCKWEHVEARKYRLCGHPTMSDEETFFAPTPCKGWTPMDALEVSK